MSDLEKTLTDRRTQHGDFTDHARIAQSLKAVMWDEPGWARLSPTQREALEMVQHKIARILAGDPNHLDHWDDIQGYAKIARDRIPRDSEEAK